MINSGRKSPFKTCKAKNRFEDHYSKIFNDYMNQTKGKPQYLETSVTKKKEPTKKSNKKGIKIYLNQDAQNAESATHLHEAQIRDAESRNYEQSELNLMRSTNQRSNSRLKTYQSQSRLLRNADDELSPEKMQDVRDQWKARMLENNQNERVMQGNPNINSLIEFNQSYAMTHRPTTRDSIKSKNSEIDQMTNKNLKRIVKNITRNNYNGNGKYVSP